MTVKDQLNCLEVSVERAFVFSKLNKKSDNSGQIKDKECRKMSITKLSTFQRRQFRRDTGMSYRF